MTLDQIAAVEAVAETGSFRSAAVKLRRSQPAISTTIRQLESEFEIEIFDRTAYRAKLTDSGAAFLNVAKATLNSSRYTARVATELGKNKAETKIRICVDPLIAIEHLEILADECARPTLPVKLILERTILNGSRSALIEGKIELAMAACPRDETGLDKIPLENVTLVGAISCKLLQEKRKASATFLDHNAQVLTYDAKADEPPDDLLPNPIREGIGKAVFAPDHWTKVRLIQGGIGWGRMSRAELQADPNLIEIDHRLVPPTTLNMCVLRAKHRALGPIARAIWQTFKRRSKAGRNELQS